MNPLGSSIVLFSLAFFLGTLWGGFLAWIVIKKQLFKEKS